MAQMLSNDLQRRYTFIHELAFQVLRTCCCYGTYISSKTPKSSRHIAYVQTHPLPATKEKRRGGSRGGPQVVSMVIPLVENTIVSNEKAEGKATKRSTKGRIRDLGKSGGCLFHISTKCLSLRVRTVTAVIHLINSPRVINFVR